MQIGLAHGASQGGDDMGWAKWLVVEPSLEEELALERDARAVLEDENHEEIALLCSTLLKQNWYQQRIIKQSIERICEMEAKLITLEPVPRRIWWKRLFR